MADWFKGPEIDISGDLYKALVTALYAVDLRIRHNNPAVRWVMDLDWYRRIRAMAVTEEQETERAYAHARAMIPVSAVFPLRCPACPSDPFATMENLAAHAAAMADPMNREPQPGDYLLGIRMEIREDGGLPHIENRNYPANWHTAEVTRG